MDIAILGAGVAGIATAITLKKKGFSVSVYEQRPKPETIGAGVVLWPNASFVIDQLGLTEQISAIAGQPKEMARFTDKGEKLGAIDIEALDRHMGYTSYSILRRDLQDVLLEELKRNQIEIRYDHRVSGFRSLAEGRTAVVFEHGLTINPDLIIGADGRMRSVAREYVLGDNSPVYQGFINWIGTVETEQPILTEENVFDFWGQGERFGIVPISDRKLYWGAAATCKQALKTGPLDDKAELKARFNRWPDPIRQIIEQTALADIRAIYVHDHDPVSRWHKDNVLLIGDAAHAPLPTSGQGACQALEDAWVLAEHLNRQSEDLETQLTGFTQQRFHKTSAITHGARSLARSLFDEDRKNIQQRNESAKEMDYQAMADGMAKGWGSGLPLGASEN